MPPTLSEMIHNAFQMSILRCNDVMLRHENPSKQEASFHISDGIFQHGYSVFFFSVAS